jgi:hypothetical protein
LRFEEATKAAPLAALRTRIRATELLPGDLLWQGAAGYCVVTKATPRLEGQKVPVLRLQNQSEESHFVASYTMPIGSLLEEAVLPLSPGFSTEPRRVLCEFLDELRSSLGAESATGKRQG